MLGGYVGATALALVLARLREAAQSAMDAGINVVDTAEVYSDGESEEIVGKALRGRRDSVVLATKVRPRALVATPDAGDDPNRRGNSRRWIMTAVENSLRRLQTDYIDLYQTHRPDPDADIEETCRRCRT